MLIFQGGGEKREFHLNSRSLRRSKHHRDVLYFEIGKRGDKRGKRQAVVARKRERRIFCSTENRRDIVYK